MMMIRDEHGMNHASPVSLSHCHCSSIYFVNEAGFAQGDMTMFQLFCHGTKNLDHELMELTPLFFLQSPRTMLTCTLTK